MKLLRNYIIGLSVVALVAVGLAFLSVKGYLTRADELVLFPQDPMTVNQSEMGDKDLAKLFEGVRARATPLEIPPQIPETAYTVPLQTRTAGGVLKGAYSLHVVRMIDRNALLCDLQTGRYSKLSVMDFEKLLSHSAFANAARNLCIFPNLTLESDRWDEAVTLHPSAGDMKIFTADGTVDSVVQEGFETPVVLTLTTDQAEQKPSFQTDLKPNSWSLTLESEDGSEVTLERVEQSALIFPTEPGKYTYTLTAHWNLSTDRDWYGDLNYVLEIHLTESEPETESESVVPGDPEGETVGP